MSYLKTGEHAIKAVNNLGKHIVLDDNSNWDVSSLDKFTSMGWRPTDIVTVKSYVGSKFKIERKTKSGKVEKIEATFLAK